MKLIAGLGNPGEKFKNNRHNVGFKVVDDFSRSNGLSWRYSQDLMCYWIKTVQYVLIKPVTYMNKAGQSIKSVCDFYKIEPKDVLVIADDLDLPLGKIRMTFNGSAGGHHGIESTVESLSTMDFARLRIGIGPLGPIGESGPPMSKEQKVIEHVLSDFSDSEKEKLGDIISRAIEAVQSYVDDGVEATMNRYN
ncbi:aminoacyl-tRNA hydrolase [Candidatus Curtissbacteria bacterium]|nr:aminoacyl-tRNA hydrolase [Candidatus Curtissbacteria bacterium]